MSARLERWRGLLAGAHAYAQGGRRGDLAQWLGTLVPEDFELTRASYPVFEGAARTCIERYVGAWMPAYSALVDDLFVALHELCMAALAGELDHRQYGTVEPERVLAWTQQRFEGLLNQRADTLYMLLIELDARLELLEAHPLRGRQALADALLEFVPTLLEFTSLTTDAQVAGHLSAHLALWLELATGRAIDAHELEQLAALARAHFGEGPLTSRHCPDYIDATIELCLGPAFTPAS